jgi:hypothetical protein
MALAEKRVPKYLSMAAIVASVAFTGWLADVGNENPRKYLASMAINHHAGYGGALACQECHVVSGGAFSMHSELNCTTAKCHGSLHADTSEERALELAIEQHQPMPDAEQRARFFLDLHNTFKDRACWSCHTEHTTRPTVVPPGWSIYSNQNDQASAINAEYESILGL